MEFTALDKTIDWPSYTYKSLSLKNYERVKNVNPANLLYLLYNKFKPSLFTEKIENSNFTYLLNTKIPGVYGMIYDYKGKISFAVYCLNKTIDDENALLNAREAAARVLTDFIDHVVIKPLKIGEFKFFATSGRFEYSGKDLFEEMGLDQLP